jgi:nitrogen fixation NifU-like protein
MSKDLNKMYNDILINEARNPYHFEKKEDAQEIVQAYNPICGDKFELYINKDEKIIKSLYFHGFGCLLSKASTSFLSNIVENKEPQEIAKIVSEFIIQIENEKEITREKLKVFSEHENFSGRKDCILLSWKAMKKSLDKLI